MTTVPGEPSTSQSWGVTVQQVERLAPHITVYTGDVPDTPDNVYGKTQRRITHADVAGWIEEVGSTVDIRLIRRATLTPSAQERIAGLAKAATAVGAGSYLVAAGMPNKAGVNENSSYSAELWKRYETMVDSAVAAIDSLLDNPNDAGEENVHLGGKVGASFPPVTIGDYGGW